MGDVIVVLKGERPWSWNKFYSGVHWSKRKEEADRIHMLVKAEIMNAHYKNCLPYQGSGTRVDIHVTAYFRGRPQDSDNICDKFYIDGLIGSILVDDDRRYVRRCTTQSELDALHPRVEIEITEVKE